jgi:hypothetical protein
MPIAQDTFANTATSTVQGGAGGPGTVLNAGDTSLTLLGGGGVPFPATGPCRLMFGVATGAYEIAIMTARTGDTFTIVRGQEGTAAQTWGLGTPVQQVTTAANMANLWRQVKDLPYNVKNYGAIGDGATDDSAAIQAALDACRVAGGGEVYFPGADYNLATLAANAEIASVKAALQVGSNTTLRGDGPGKSRLKLGGGWARNPLMGVITPTHEFWVSPGGNNGNAGTKALPFLTIGYAVSQCTLTGGGYLIHIAPGTYNEAQIDTYAGSTQSGINGNPNVILSDVPWAAKVTCTTTGTNARAFYLRAGWWVVGFEITGSTLAGANAVSLDGSYSAAIHNYIHDFGTTAGEGVEGITITSYLATGIVVASNYIFRVGPLSGGFPSHGLYINGNANVVANNLIVSQQGAGIQCFHTPSNLVIVGNTCFNCGAGSNDGGIMMGSGDAGWTVSGCLVANNILVNNTQYGLRELVSGGAAMGAQTYTNNLEFGNSVGAYLAVGANTNSNAQTTDPLFVNQQTDGTGDFRLRPGSPAIDNGSDASMPATWGVMDFLGYTRPVGTHRDIGCYEYLGWAFPGAAVICNYNPSTGNKDIVFEDITIDGGAAAATGEAAGIALVRVQRPRFINTSVKNILGARDQGINDAPGVLLDYCSDVDATGLLLFTDDGGPSGSGLISRYSFNLDLRGVKVEGLLYGNGILLDTCANPRLEGFGVGACGGVGVSLRTCRDFTLADGDAGLEAAVAAAYPYTAGQLLGNTGHGVYILASDGVLNNVHAARNGGAGIWVDGAGQLDLVDCRARNNTSYGFMVAGSVGGGQVQIMGAKARSNGAPGYKFLTAALAQLSRISSSTAAGNTTAALEIAALDYSSIAGALTTPAFPATTVVTTNPFPFDLMVYITGGTVTLISLDGSGIGTTTAVPLRLRAGGTIAVTYTGTPAWGMWNEG